MKLISRLAVLVALALAAGTAQADVRLPRLFSDHMLLQRDLADAVWGWAAPGEAVTVTMAGQTVSTTADNAGLWQVHLSPMKAGGPYELVVAGMNSITIRDILVGDVWLCSGQSNMDFGLAAADNGNAAVAASANPRIRLLNDKGPDAPEPATDIPTGWMVCNPQSAASFSAVGYFFGKRIQAETGVPIGLINNAWGATGIEMWLNLPGLRSVPELAGFLKGYEDRQTKYAIDLETYMDVAGRWLDQARAARANGEKIPIPPTPPTPAVPTLSPTSIYNGRVAPLTPYGIKGVLWYQGENNSAEGDLYYRKMCALIGGWRAAWNQRPTPGSNYRWDLFPFYFVQLANFGQSTNYPGGGDGFAGMRVAQLKALQIPHTGMAVTIDIGSGDNIHPTNKEDVGNRLALWALKNEYGQSDLVCSGPLYKEMKTENDKIRISFDDTGSGLMAGRKERHGPAQEVKDGTLHGFAIAGENKEWVWADAVIDGPTVVVSNPDVPHPAAVRYAFSANPVFCNLYNKEGLPASPFRTDAW